MIFIEIILVVVGLCAVVLSYRISDRDKNMGDAPNLEGSSQRQEVDEQDLSKVRGQLEQYKEEAVEAASDELSRLSNEKILGMDEYSSQVLERMNKNHEEVVFLYNMLGEKENEIKDLVHHVDSVKAQIHEETAAEYQNMVDMLSKLKESRLVVEQQMEQAEPQEEVVSPVLLKKPSTDARPQVDQLKKTQAGHLAESVDEIFAAQDQRTSRQETGKKVVKSDDTVESARKKSGASARMPVKNHNQEIVDLHKKGHSILEISKMLSLGQGEVKFVIDLYENER